MAHIVLRGGLVVTYDDADIGLISGYVWHRHLVGPNLYAKGYPKGNRKAGLVYMHRLLTGAAKGIDVDHKNGNGLDNRKENLRVVTCRQNLQNRHSSKSSQFPGVSWQKCCGKWKAAIKIKGRSNYLGVFTDEAEAAIAYRVACEVMVNDR